MKERTSKKEKEDLSKSLAAKLNVLESVIVRGEDSVEDARWGQAKEVARLIEVGHTQQEIAAGWINGRTDRPYGQDHVSVYVRVWHRYGLSHSRPSWTDAAATVKSGSDELVTTTEVQRQVHESRIPTSPETAERFVKNLAKAPDSVLEAIQEGATETLVERSRARRAEHQTESTVGDLMGDDRFDPAEYWADTLIIRVNRNARELAALTKRAGGLLFGTMPPEDAFDYLHEAERLIAEARAAAQEQVRDRAEV